MKTKSPRKPAAPIIPSNYLEISLKEERERRETLQICIRPDLANKIENLATKNKLTRSRVVERLLEKLLDA